MPAEVVISRINKRIHSRIALIGLLHINTTHTQQRIRTIDATMDALDKLHEKMDEVDINFVRMRKIDYLDTYEKLERKNILEKSSQYPILHRLHKLKKRLSEQEQLIIDDEYKYELLENRLEKMTNEIDSINYENDLILNENNLLKRQIADIKKVPTITDYAYIIQQTNQLQHEIIIWTKRVKIIEVNFLKKK
jgi:hypothetical protein